MKKNAGRKQRRNLARANNREAGRKTASHNEWLQKMENRQKNSPLPQTEDM